VIAIERVQFIVYQRNTDNAEFAFGHCVCLTPKRRGAIGTRRVRLRGDLLPDYAEATDYPSPAMFVCSHRRTSAVCL